MNNKELIFNLARRMERFSFDDILVMSELEESVVEKLILELIKEGFINKIGEQYFYIKQKKDIKKFNQQAENQTFEIEKLKGYDEYLKLSQELKEKTDRNLEIIKLTQGLKRAEAIKMLKLYTQSTGYKISYATLYILQKSFEQEGLKGILAYKKKAPIRKIPSEILEIFKKYYLTNEKLTPEEALVKTAKDFKKEYKIDFPDNITPKCVLYQLQKTISPERIEILRNSVAPIIKTKKQTKEDIINERLFSEAAQIYMKKLKRDKELEKLINAKTSYNNHLADYFDNYKLKDLTQSALSEYKQAKFNEGYSLSSVKTYLLTLKQIVLASNPDFHFLTKIQRTYETIDMNILNEFQVKQLLKTTKSTNYWAYPILKLALSTGATIPEILALKWDCINFEKQEFYTRCFLYLDKTVKNRGNHSYRYLKIDYELIDILKEKYNIQKPKQTDFVFEFPKNDYPLRYFEKKILKPFEIIFEIKNFVSNDLRHTFVNMMVQKDVPIFYITRICGYSSIGKFLSIYNQLYEKKFEGPFNPIENLKI